MRPSRRVIAGRISSVAVAVWLPLAAGCTDSTGPDTGAIRVALATTGLDIDPDGYAVSVDGRASGDVGANGALTISGVRRGAHKVRLEGLAANCTADHGTELAVSVAAGREVTAAFAVSCAGLRAAVAVTTQTTGADLDQDGYTVAVDGVAMRTVVANGTVTIENLDGGTHDVALSGTAANCTVDGDNPRSVSIARGETARVSFAVTCVAAFGTITVATQTSGVDLDPDGYVATVDAGAAARSVGTIGSVTIASIVAGTHTVTLGGVAPNCTVGGDNPRSVSVALGQTTSVTFVVTCSAAAGGVRVTTVTTGENLDPDGYTVEIWTPNDYYYYYSSVLVDSQHIDVNATARFPFIRPGDYTVRLTGVAPNCTVGGSQPVPVKVTLGNTSELAFAVQCAATGAIRVTNATTGPDPDPDGYGLSIVGGSFAARNSLPTGGSVTISGLLPATYRLTLTGVAENCALSGSATRDVVVPSTVTTTVALDVACTPATRLALVSERDGNSEIYTVNSNGTGLVRLTNNPARDLEPAWSPDGRRIAFMSDRGAAAGVYDIYLMDADGANVVRRTTEGAPNSGPAWSPDGRKIAFVSTRTGNPEIWVMGADDGSAPIRLTDNIGNDADPAWSPDGSRIAFASARGGTGDVYVMNGDGSGLVRLTRGSGGVISYSRPAWSPDGRRIAFLRTDCSNYYYDYGCTLDVGVINADGSGETRLAADVYESRSAWSPDGRTLAFSANTCSAGRCVLSVVYTRTDGSSAGAVEPIVLDGHSPSWRP